MASDPTLWRALEEIGAEQRAWISAARAKIRKRVWALIEARHGAIPPSRVAEVDLGGDIVIKNIRVGDALAGEDGRVFDVVLANPPYVDSETMTRHHPALRSGGLDRLDRLGRLLGLVRHLDAGRLEQLPPQ